MKLIKALFLAIGVSLIAASNSMAALPWLTGTHTINIQAPSAGAATCTSFSTSEVCYLNLTGDLTALTLSGGSAGGNYLLIFQQDGTGSRAFTAPTNLTYSSDFAALPSIPSAANTYTAWAVQKVGTNYQLQAAYDNIVVGANTNIWALPASSTNGQIINWAFTNKASILPTGAFTLTMRNGVKGDNQFILATQDSTGRAVTLAPVPVAASGVTTGTDLITNLASSVSVLQMFYDGTSYNVVSGPLPVQICAGTVSLSSATPSTATVSNKCFTGAGNVVLCSMTSGSASKLNGIMCVPAAGSLAIAGPDSVTNTVSWARIQ